MLAVFAMGSTSSCLELLEDPPEGLSEEEIVKGLKEALKVSSDTTTKKLHRDGGYYAKTYNGVSIKIPWPKDVAKVKNTLEDIGLDPLVDEVVKKMNRAAEDAAIKAKPIFINAITNITIQDGQAILQGNDTAATHYLRNNTADSLRTVFKPDIQASMEKVGAQQAWEEATTRYNQIPFQEDVQTDLSAYVTARALDGLFVVVGQQERKIRMDVDARVTDLLRKVFKEQDANTN